jgi:hypothetical protein
MVKDNQNPKKKHMVKLHVNLSLNGKALQNTLNETMASAVSSTAKITQDSAEALRSILSRGNQSMNATTLNREFENFKKMLDLIPEGLK